MLKSAGACPARIPAPQDCVLVDRLDPCVPTMQNGKPCCTVDKLPPHLEGVQQTGIALAQLHALIK